MKRTVSALSLLLSLSAALHAQSYHLSAPVAPVNGGSAAAAAGRAVIGPQGQAAPAGLTLGPALSAAGDVRIRRGAAPAAVTAALPGAAAPVASVAAANGRVALPRAEAKASAAGGVARALASPAAASPALRSSLRELGTGVESRASALRDPSGASGWNELSSLYDGRGRSRGAAPVVGTGSADRSSGLERAGASEPSSPDQAPPAPEGPQAPRSSFARTFKVGYVAGWFMLLYNFGIPAIANALGIPVNTTYVPPPLVSHTVSAAIALGLAVAAMAPIAEEVIFRGGLQGWLRKHFSALPKAIGTFWLPALLSSAVFVPLHEYTDPVTILVYTLLSMTLSRMYYKEGILAGMVTHATYNGILVSVMIGGFFAAELPAILGVAALGLPVLIWAARGLWRQRADRAAGRVVPLAMNRATALGLGAFLLAGTVAVGVLGNAMLAIGGGVFWVPAAIGLFKKAGRS